MKTKPPLKIQTTTLWEYPSQHYGAEVQGDKEYAGATPSYVIWNLLQRYTRPGDLVVDPMCGSGTTLDVARDLGRRALGYDVAPHREDIFRVDARKLPLENEKVDFVFVDPPYSTHLEYSDDPRCIGKLDALSREYYDAMDQVIRESYRILKDHRYMALYCSDSWQKKKPFAPIGFRLFSLLERYFQPVDIVTVVRHNRTLKRHHYHTEAEKGNYFLRGFNYLFIMKKEAPERGKDSETQQRSPLQSPERTPRSHKSARRRR
ncbi:MAG: DNA methylase [Candidatus Hydrogenedentes bacterium]|nr:DNA methylase [Candidatus Hydrogenedentota bacterium]